MRGSIVYVGWITRGMVRAEPEARFVFGDNALRKGLGGQAKAMRGEPNAIGIATKWAPNMREGSFFSDVERAGAAKDIVAADLLKVQEALAEGRTTYVPADGLGTGLSQLPTRAPSIYKMIWDFFERKGRPCPWPKA